MSQTPPWNEHRALAESVAQSVADALTSATGTIVEVGKAASFDPESMLSARPLPLHAVVVQLRRPLRDVMIFVTALKPDAVMPYVEAAAEATIAAIDVPVGSDQHGPTGRFEIVETFAYESAEEAIEQCDALFLEATYPLELPTGELRLVLGTGLLESASCFANGAPDPFAVEAPLVHADGELVLGDEIGVEDGARYELGDEAIVGDRERAELVLDASASPEAGDSAGGIAAYEAMLAAQEQAEAEAAAALAATAAEAAAATTAANVEAAELPAFSADATERWTQLLSGVEVELSAELGRTDLALGEITNLEQDCVLTLEQLVHEPVSVYVNGTRYATARLVVVDGEYGIEILEVVEQDQFVGALAA
jgi:flagellar motor switch protein FliN/FliY